MVIHGPGLLPRNAANVLTATMGLTTGEASRYVTAQDTGRPFFIRRRMTGTTPHSHIGNTTPSSPLTATAAPARLGRKFVIQRAGTNTSIRPEISAPSSRNGTLSKSTLRNDSAKLAGSK